MKKKIAVFLSVLALSTSLVNASSLDNSIHVSSVTDSLFGSLNTSIGISALPIFGLQHLIDNSAQTFGIFTGALDAIFNAFSSALDLVDTSL